MTDRDTTASALPEGLMGDVRDIYLQGFADGADAEQQRIRQLAVEVRAEYPNPGAGQGSLREVLCRSPTLPFADLLERPAMTTPARNTPGRNPQ